MTERRSVAMYRNITVSEDTRLHSLLDEAKNTAILLDRDGEYFFLTPAGASASLGAYDAVEAQKALEAAVGSWSDIDADALIASIHRWREEGSRHNEGHS